MNRPHHTCSSHQRPVTDAAARLDRREFLWRSGGGLGGIALSYLLGSSSAFPRT